LAAENEGKFGLPSLVTSVGETSAFIPLSLGKALEQQRRPLPRQRILTRCQIFSPLSPPNITRMAGHNNCTPFALPECDEASANMYPLCSARHGPGAGQIQQYALLKA